ncbi:hypothetical protein N9M90_01000 [Alphaproteobacteria bacterium]|nr:hypothetical protein [Alphaproteobacteria bacterium]
MPDEIATYKFESPVSCGETIFVHHGWHAPNFLLPLEPLARFGSTPISEKLPNLELHKGRFSFVRMSTEIISSEGALLLSLTR